jgi:arsenate reductase (glutaredoxin)
MSNTQAPYRTSVLPTTSSISIQASCELRTRLCAVDEVCVWFNPGCSKCRTARELLEERGVAAEYFHYLDSDPGREDIERVMQLARIDDPRAMMRTSEPLYQELGLAKAERDDLIDAMVRHPILIERPIVIRGERAVVARPPERLLELF